MIPVELIQANFRLQEKTYKKYMIDLYIVYPVSEVLNGHWAPVNDTESSGKN